MSNRPQQVNVNVNTKFIRFIAIGFLAILLFIILTNTTFMTIESGQHGVLFQRFGGGLDKENIYSQGFHVVAPWNKMFIYDTRVQENFEEMNVLSKNGLNIEVELSYRYLPISNKMGNTTISDQYSSGPILAFSHSPIYRR